MAITGAQKSKRDSMQAVLKFIENEGPIGKDVLHSRLQVEFGLSDAKADEWLNTLDTGGYVSITDDEVAFNEGLN